MLVFIMGFLRLHLVCTHKAHDHQMKCQRLLHSLKKKKKIRGIKVLNYDITE